MNLHSEILFLWLVVEEIIWLTIHQVFLLFDKVKDECDMIWLPFFFEKLKQTRINLTIPNV